MCENKKILGQITISGPDATAFLQGQVTCDINECNEQDWRLGAICNYQGRMLCSFQAKRAGPDIILRLPICLVEPTLAYLHKYAIFSQVTLSDSSNEVEQRKDWYKQAVDAGIATIYAQTSERFLPHQVNFQQVQGISFNKGCYTGQEIIARMHYKGKLKQHAYRFELMHPEVLAPGTQLCDNQGKPIATIIDSYVTENHRQHSLLTMQDHYANETEFYLSEAGPAISARRLA